MPDYKEMYLKMVRASEQAINILIEAQRECEELYISGQERTAQARMVSGGCFQCPAHERQRAGEGERVAKRHAPEGS